MSSCLRVAQRLLSDSRELSGVEILDHAVCRDNAAGVCDTERCAFIFVIRAAVEAAVVYAGNVQTGDDALILAKSTAVIVRLHTAERGPDGGFILKDIVSVAAELVQQIGGFVELAVLAGFAECVVFLHGLFKVDHAEDLGALGECTLCRPALLDCRINGFGQIGTDDILSVLVEDAAMLTFRFILGFHFT